MSAPILIRLTAFLAGTWKTAVGLRAHFVNGEPYADLNILVTEEQAAALKILGPSEPGWSSEVPLELEVSVGLPKLKLAVVAPADLNIEAPQLLDQGQLLDIAKRSDLALSFEGTVDDNCNSARDVPRLQWHITAMEEAASVFQEQLFECAENHNQLVATLARVRLRLEVAERTVEEERQRHSVTRNQLAKATAKVEELERDISLQRDLCQGARNDARIYAADLATRSQELKQERRDHDATLAELKRLKGTLQ